LISVQTGLASSQKLEAALDALGDDLQSEWWSLYFQYAAKRLDFIVLL
jgi:hypothetical protein